MVYCENCGYGDSGVWYCEDCFRRLKKKIEELERRIYDLEYELEMKEEE